MRLAILVVVGCGRVGFGAIDPATGDAAADGAPDVSIACTPPYVMASGGCYRVVPAGRTWLAAEMDCEADGAHLIIIADVAEHDVLHGLLMAQSVVTTWIGYSDRRTESAFRWVGPGGVDAATDNVCFWGPGGVINSPVNDCVTANAANGCPDWTVIDCGAMRPYVCERDGLTIDPTSF